MAGATPAAAAAESPPRGPALMQDLRPRVIGARAWNLGRQACST